MHNVFFVLWKKKALASDEIKELAMGMTARSYKARDDLFLYWNFNGRLGTRQKLSEQISLLSYYLIISQQSLFRAKTAKKTMFDVTSKE